MPLIPLPAVQAGLRPGAPLPWDILNDKGHVLWSRGNVLSASEFVSVGLGRGLYSDSLEVLEIATDACANKEFFTRWDAWGLRLAVLLRSPDKAHFLVDVREAAEALVSLAAFDADKLLFAVLRHDHSQFGTYGVAHSQHVAALCGLLTQRLGWSALERIELACAALTMNLSILELQGTLAAGGGRLTTAQKAQVRSHPEHSAKLLARAGLPVGAWMTAVANHHERSDGTGYPCQPVELDVFSRLLHLVDIFTAKHAARFDRQPVPAAEAVRSLEHSQQPEAAQLAEVVGAYPPGCFVRLTSGEAGVVLRRAIPSGAGPVLAILQDANKRLLPVPQLRRTTLALPAIAHALDDSTLLVRLNPEALYSPPALAQAA
jgi:hypothetical protein